MKTILKSLATVAAAAALLAACREEEHAEAPAPRPVLSVAVGSQIEGAVVFAGTIEPRYKSDHSFQVLGRIISRELNVGSLVKKGQRLATLDPLTYQLAVRSAQADLASATARRENAVATEVRQRTLLYQTVATQAQYDSARASRETAEANVTSAKANLDKAKEQLGYTELRADFDGVITAVKAEQGQVVQPGQTVFTVARPDIREAVVDLPDGIGRSVRPGARFDIVLQVNRAVRATGTVREIAPQADSTTRTTRVKISLPDPPVSFRLGTTIEAKVTRQATPSLELPVSALLERDGKTSVWVVDPATRTVLSRDVTIASRDGSNVRVLDGLTSGTRVVTAGVNSLKQGEAVMIHDGSFQ
jgi:RND family efflux transporter MFP subunit